MAVYGRAQRVSCFPSAPYWINGYNQLCCLPFQVLGPVIANATHYSYFSNTEQTCNLLFKHVTVQLTICNWKNLNPMCSGHDVAKRIYEVQGLTMCLSDLEWKNNCRGNGKLKLLWWDLRRNVLMVLSWKSNASKTYTHTLTHEIDLILVRTKRNENTHPHTRALPSAP